MTDMLSAQLGRRVPAPDMTASIMRRLGFARISGPSARRRRVRRAAGRAAMGAAAVGACALGAWLYRLGLEPVGPTGPTIPSAIQHDWKRHEQVINRAIRTIRGLSPHWTAGRPPEAPGHDEVPQHEDSGATPAPSDRSASITDEVERPVRPAFRGV